MTITAALFDIDGTLIDSNDLHVRAWSEAFAQAGHDINADAIHQQIGKGGDNLVPALLPDASEDEQKSLAGAHGKIFKSRYLDQAMPFPQARALLEHVRSHGIKVVLASSAKKDELDHYVGLMDAEALIDERVSIDDVEASKPAPDIFATALKKAGVGAEGAIAIGDTPYDIDAAGKLGVKAIGMLSGGFSRQDLAAAVTLYDDVAALLADFDASPLGA